jgi:FtsP/CotA-like multicopper oxidase with cupredoxin domain
MAGMSALPGMAGVGTSAVLGGDAGDISYPYYLINGRIPAAPTSFTAKPGQRIRIRIINAGSDTAFRVALAGHPMTVTHTDGYPVQPTEVDALLIGMGERYDVIVAAGDGVFALVALAEGKNALARAVLSTGAGTAPDPGFQPPELNGRLGTADILVATPADDLGSAKPDTTLNAELSGSMMPYDWKINGHSFTDRQPLPIRRGQRATLTFTNTTTCGTPCICTATPSRSSSPTAAPARAKTPSSCCRSRQSASTWWPTIPASGCCTATTPTTKKPA